MRLRITENVPPAASSETNLRVRNQTDIVLVTAE